LYGSRKKSSAPQQLNRAFYDGEANGGRLLKPGQNPAGFKTPETKAKAQFPRQRLIRKRQQWGERG